MSLSHWSYLIACNIEKVLRLTLFQELLVVRIGNPTVNSHYLTQISLCFLLYRLSTFNQMKLLQIILKINQNLKCHHLYLVRYSYPNVSKMVIIFCIHRTLLKKRNPSTKSHLILLQWIHPKAQMNRNRILIKHRSPQVPKHPANKT